MSDESKAFYGDAYGRAKHPEKLDQAYDRLIKALGTSNPNLGDKMLTLAAKAETEAFTD